MQYCWLSRHRDHSPAAMSLAVGRLRVSGLSAPGSLWSRPLPLGLDAIDLNP